MHIILIYIINFFDKISKLCYYVYTEGEIPDWCTIEFVNESLSVSFNTPPQLED